MNKILKLLAVGGISYTVGLAQNVHVTNFPMKIVRGEVLYEDYHEDWHNCGEATVTFTSNYIYLDRDNGYGDENMYMSNGVKLIVYDAEEIER